MSQVNEKSQTTTVNMKAESYHDEEINEVEGIVDDKQIDNNVFAETDEGPDFRGVSWPGAAVLIAKTQFGLGVIGLPQTFHAMGFVPGLLSLLILCFLITWTGVVVGRFRLNHPEVHSIGDAAYLIFGRPGFEAMGFITWFFYTLCYASGTLTVSIGFNSMTEHPICTMWWVGMAAGVSLAIGLATRTMKALSWCGYIAVVSAVTGVWVVVIACLAQKTPAAAPPGEPINKDIRITPTGKSSYAEFSGAIGTQILSLAGTASFFIIHAEMRDQTKFVKSLICGQGLAVSNYIVISCIVYAKVGQYVASPALGSAGPLIKKIAYGISMPALIFACFFQAHLAAKYAFVRVLRNTTHLQSNSFVHWATWIGMMTFVHAVGLVIAGSIPFFDNLVGLTGALFGTSFTLIIPGFMALYELAEGDNKSGNRPIEWLKLSQKTWGKSRKTMVIAILSWTAIAVGSYVGVSGTYGAIASIAKNYADGTVGSAFSCEDNSGTT